MPFANVITDSGIISPQSYTGGEVIYSGIIGVIASNNFGNCYDLEYVPNVPVSSDFFYKNQVIVNPDLPITKKAPDDKFQVIIINRLIKLNLSKPLNLIIEPDDDAFIVRCPDLPVFGFADNTIDAITSLKREIESLYYELMEDNNFSPQWLCYKAFLQDNILAPQ